MKKLVFVLVLMYCSTHTQGQGIFDVRVVELQMGYGVSNLMSRNLNSGSTFYWNKPVGWASGFRMTTNFVEFSGDSQTVDNPYVRAYSWYSGLDYQLTDDFSKHKLIAHASFGMAYYQKRLTILNLITEPDQITLISPHLRFAGRYQYQFGIVGLFVQPWMFIGKVQEFGADFGMVLRRENW